MRPNVPDPYTVEQQVSTYRKHLNALTEAHVSLYESYLLGMPIDGWTTRIVQLIEEGLAGWPMLDPPMLRDEYYRLLTERFNG